MSEVIPAAIVHRYGPVSELEYGLMPGIGGVTATTDLGTMPLYKAGPGGQAIYVSPQTDTVVVYFSTTWQNLLSIISYARAIVIKHLRGE